ncbi:MAG: ABC transporter permease, partial [Gammaproteobacteria bacterium]
MFTRCANHECETAYRVTAETLRSSMGMIRCVKCRTVFNALANIVDTRPASAVIALGNQLPFVQMVGDREVMDPKLLRSMPWFKEFQTTRPPLRDDEVFAPAALDSEADARDEIIDTHPVEDALDALERELVAQGPPAPGVTSASPALSFRRRLRESIPSPADVLHAARNLTRHRRRTAMGILAISFGVMAMLVAGGFIEWIQWTMREGTIQSHLGHIQVVKRDYFKRGEADPFAFLLPAKSPVFEAIERLPEVEAITPRLSFSGLVSFGDVSIAFLGEGVDPTKEAKVSRRMSIIDGTGLSPDQPDGIIVGKGLAENLRVKPGDQVVLLANPAAGGLSAIEGKVVGIFQTSSKPFDDSYLRVSIDAAQKLMKTEGAQRWVVLLKDTELTDSVIARVRSEFSANQDFEFVPWIDLADFYRKTVVLFSAQINVIWFVIALIIVVSISNTLIMNVMERTGEIGTLMALGLKRQKILGLFVNEGILLGMLGGVAGAVLGLSVGALISAIGIPMPPAPGMDFSFDGEVRITWGLALGGFALGLA